MERRYYVEVAGQGDPDLEARAFVEALKAAGFAVLKAESIELPSGQGYSLLEAAQESAERPEGDSP